MTGYPTAFYVAHRLFSGSAFPKPVWGDVLDGPQEDFSEVVTDVWDAFEFMPTRATLRVWFVDGNVCSDETDRVIEACTELMEALYD